MGNIISQNNTTQSQALMEIVKTVLQQMSNVTKPQRKFISIACRKICKADAHLLERFSSYLGLDFNNIKSRPDFEQLCNYGAIAT